jgi:hypothetical protein
MSPPPGPPTEQPLADVVAAARDLSDLAQKLQYGQRVSDSPNLRASSRLE